jgi:BirA family transcriptional regulator, biotin operon repressor / biotin---[acetyl-CoA-carboxylase] ligase
MIGAPRVHHRVADSTNERAKELAAAGAPHGTVVTADEQTAGRGRQGRAWTAPPRSAVLMSVVVRDLGESAALLPLAAAVAVCEASESAAGVRCEIKWPNDVWIDGRKLAGILVEARPAAGWAVVGIGLNVSTTGDEFPPELRGVATSLGAAAPIDEVLAALLRALERWLSAPPAEVLSQLRVRDALRGKRLRWDDGSGVAAGIDDSGALIVDTPAGRERLDAGEVHLEI